MLTKIVYDKYWRSWFLHDYKASSGEEAKYSLPRSFASADSSIDCCRFFSLRACEPFFVKISARNGEKSEFLKKFFWTISLRHIAYHLSWKITYFCAKFQLWTYNSFWVYKEHTDRHTEWHTGRHTEFEIYVYI